MFMSEVKMFFRSPTPFYIVNCNTLLSLGMIPLPVSIFPWQVSHSLASQTSWGLQANPGFNFRASHNGLFRPPFRDTPDTCLASATFLNPFLLSLTLNPEPRGQSCQVLLLAGSGTCFACSITSSPAFCF